MTMQDVRLAPSPTPAPAVEDFGVRDGAWARRFAPDDPGVRGMHDHHQHEIAWVSDGITTAQVGDRQWVLPPTQAIWIPSGAPHDLVRPRPSTLHCLYVAPERCPLDWREPVVLAVTPMLRELLLTLSQDRGEAPVSEAAETLLYALLKPLSQTALQLPLPTDYRAVALAQAVLSRPSDGRTLDEWADYFEASATDLRRAFVDETGLTFDEWRTQSRLRASLVLLAQRMPVETVASKVGYVSASGFVDAFRRHFGHTPGHSLAVRR
jgi:AraC-like DNA-binding protein